MGRPKQETLMLAGSTIFEIADDIRRHVRKAESEFPEWPIDPLHGIAVVQEECGEAVKATLDYVYHNGAEKNIEIELKQTAAMCVRMLGWLKRHKEDA